MSRNKPLSQWLPRCTGVLLHPSSLPSTNFKLDESVQGTLGASAYHFIDFLQSCGVKVWQCLPLVPTHRDLSPYMGLSVMAGNPYLISLEMLQNWHWIDSRAVSVAKSRRQIIAMARRHVEALADKQTKQWQDFVKSEAHWLEDYALFSVIRETHQHNTWTAWPTELRTREKEALKNFQSKHRDALADVMFEQYVFYRQWMLLKNYANERGVYIFGDMPIFVAHDSAEVWANPDQFDLKSDGMPRTIAGVPPDYFSETGQRWGNPHYNWSSMQENNFAWWQKRVENALHLYDFLRIDHFRGFQAYWEIDAKEEYAINGCWKEAPGEALFSSLKKRFKRLPLVAEDLGVITEEVTKLRDKFAFPGMKILQFAFDGNAANPYLPHNHPINCVVYTGTHDNNTSRGWYQELDKSTRAYVHDYLGLSNEAMPWQLIRTALASTAFLAVVPMQDLLGLDSHHRMNTPGHPEDNWRWRFKWEQVQEGLPQRVRHLNKLYGRI